jgi:hypothetical protein
VSLFLSKSGCPCLPLFHGALCSLQVCDRPEQPAQYQKFSPQLRLEWSSWLQTALWHNHSGIIKPLLRQIFENWILVSLFYCNVRVNCSLSAGGLWMPSRALLEKLTVAQLVKKFIILYGTRSFISLHYSGPVGDWLSDWMVPGRSGKNSVSQWNVNPIFY